MVRWSAALLNISLGTVTCDEGEGSWEGAVVEAPPPPLPVLVVLPTLAGDGIGDRLCVCVRERECMYGCLDIYITSYMF